MGGTPKCLCMVRLRCALSANPASCAARLKSAPAAALDKARCNFSHRRYGRRGIPTIVRNRCRKWLADNEASPASAASVVFKWRRPGKLSMTRRTRSMPWPVASRTGICAPSGARSGPKSAALDWGQRPSTAEHCCRVSARDPCTQVRANASPMRDSRSTNSIQAGPDATRCSTSAPMSRPGAVISS